jgi:hypothetical protein
MANQDPARAAILLSYPSNLPDDVLEEFLKAVEPLTPVAVDRQQKGPYAGTEWLMPTIVGLMFGGFTKDFFAEAGKEAYQATKKAVVRLWLHLSKVQTIAIASAPNKLAPHDRYSRTFSLVARNRQGSVKLLIANNATEEEMADATDAFFRFLGGVNDGPPVDLRYSGGVALVTFDPVKRTLRVVDINEK